MKKRSIKNQSQRLMQLIDIFLVLVAFTLGALLRNDLVDFLGVELPPKDVLSELWWMLIVAVLIMPIALDRFEFYSGDLRKKFIQSLWQLIQSSAILAGLIAYAIIFLKVDPSSRLAIFSSFSLMMLALLIRDRLWRNYRRSLAKNQKYKELVLYAGAGRDLNDLLDETPDDVKDYWDIVATFDFNKRSTSELRDILDECSIQRVVFSVQHGDFEKLSEAVEICEIQGVEAWIHAGFMKTQLARPDFDSLGDKPMLVLRSTPELSWSLLMKSTMDRFGALCLILFTLPLWIFAWIGIKLSSPGAPAIFIQERSGRFGRPFRMFKFRTMNPDAEEKLKKVKDEVGNQMEGPVFKLDEDPRVFQFGSFLRKTSIDELPQLVNVLLGDMSLVGPRPLPVYEVKEFEEAKHRRRLSVKPGITCTWQAGGRNQITSFEEWVDMDLAYIDSWSLWQDVVILIKTIPAVLFSKGAK